jgi:beta-N-acetylhexosaminidase
MLGGGLVRKPGRGRHAALPPARSVERAADPAWLGAALLVATIATVAAVATALPGEDPGGLQGAEPAGAPTPARAATVEADRGADDGALPEEVPARGQGAEALGRSPAPAAESPAGPSVPACPSVDSLTLRQQIAQTLFVGVDGSSDDAVRALAQVSEPVGGIFVGGEATDVFTSGVLRDLGEPPQAPLVAVDDEGGRVQRVDALVGDLPSGKELGALDPTQVRALAEERGRALVDVGVTMDFAPVVDVGGRADGGVIGDRAFGTTPDDIVVAAGAFADGLRAAGVLPTLKHFPGHGRADGDSHLGTVTTPSWPELLEVDVVPYRLLADDGDVAVMVGHLVVPGLSTPGVPTSLDPAVYDALRDDVGFEGLVVTDDLSNMRAVSADFGPREAARRALQSGADMALLVAVDDHGALVDALEADVEGGGLDRDRVAAAAAAVLGAKGC